MKALLLWMLITLIGIPFYSTAQIHTLTIGHFTTDTLLKYNTSRHPQTLFLFDLDNTLIVTNNYKYGSDTWSAYIAGRLKDSGSLYYDLLFNIISPVNFASLQYTPVFPGQEEIIGQLASHNFTKVLGLTSRSPGIAAITAQNLSDAGYWFQHQHTGDAFRMPELINSIIYTKGGNKGEALYRFLVAYPEYQRYFIVYVDDTRSKVEKVNTFFEERKQAKDPLVSQLKYQLVHLYNPAGEESSLTPGEKQRFWEDYIRLNDAYR